MFSQRLIAFRIFFTKYSISCKSGIGVALLYPMNTRTLILLIFSVFLFDTVAEARSCRSCSGVRRGGPVRRWVQSRRGRRSCRSCQPRRCGNGSCGQSIGGHGGGAPSNPGPIDPGPSASQTPDAPSDTPSQTPDDSEAPEAPGIPGDQAAQEPAAEKPKNEERADVCLEKLEKNAKVLVAGAAVKQEDAEAQKNARSFLEVLEGAKKSNEDFSRVESPQRMYYFLKELTRKDPFADEESPWYTAQGMYMPQNYQNLVKTLGQFGAASERETQLKVLEEGIEHLGWLTSSYVWPQRGSGLTDRRHFYERSQTWVECLKKTPEAPAQAEEQAQAQAPAPEEKPQAQEQKPEAPQSQAKNKHSGADSASNAVAQGQALYQSKCVGCHLSNGIELSSFEFASKRVGNRSMPPKGAPPLSQEEISSLQAFFATQ